MARYPGVSLTVGASTEQVSLRRREADVVLRLNNSPPPALVGRRLCTWTFRPYAHRSLVERHGATMSAYPWIGDDLRREPWLDEWLADHAPGARVAIRNDGYSVLRASVRAGLGAMFLPDDAAPDFPELAPIPSQTAPISRDLWALTLPELRSNVRVRALLDHFYDALGG